MELNKIIEQLGSISDNNDNGKTYYVIGGKKHYLLSLDDQYIKKEFDSIKKSFGDKFHAKLVLKNGDSFDY